MQMLSFSVLAKVTLSLPFTLCLTPPLYLTIKPDNIKVVLAAKG